MNDQLSADDPRLRGLVIEIVNERLDAVLTRVRNDLEQAGYPDAAKYVRRVPGE